MKHKKYLILKLYLQQPVIWPRKLCGGSWFFIFCTLIFSVCMWTSAHLMLYFAILAVVTVSMFVLISVAFKCLQYFYRAVFYDILTTKCHQYLHIRPFKSLCYIHIWTVIHFYNRSWDNMQEQQYMKMCLILYLFNIIVVHKPLLTFL